MPFSSLLLFLKMGKKYFKMYPKNITYDLSANDVIETVKINMEKI